MEGLFPFFLGVDQRSVCLCYYRRGRRDLKVDGIDNLGRLQLLLQLLDSCLCLKSRRTPLISTLAVLFRNTSVIAASLLQLLFDNLFLVGKPENVVLRVTHIESIQVNLAN